MEQTTNPSDPQEPVPFRWRPLGALVGEIALRVAAERAAPEPEAPAFAPVAWAAE